MRQLRQWSCWRNSDKKISFIFDLSDFDYQHTVMWWDEPNEKCWYISEGIDKIRPFVGYLNGKYCQGNFLDKPYNGGYNK